MVQSQFRVSLILLSAVLLTLAILATIQFRESQIATSGTPDMHWKWNVGQSRRYRMSVTQESKIHFRQHSGEFDWSGSRTGDQVWELKAMESSPNQNAKISLRCESVKFPVPDDLGGTRFEIALNSNTQDTDKPKTSDKYLQYCTAELRVRLLQVYTATMSPHGEFYNSDVPSDNSELSETDAMNLILGIHTDSAIVIKSFNSLFALLCSDGLRTLDTKSSGPPYTRRREKSAPGIGTLEVLSQFTLDPTPVPDKFLQMSETCTIRRTKPDENVRNPEGDPLHDPFLLNQRVQEYTGGGRGEILFDSVTGHLVRRTLTLESTTRSTTGVDNSVTRISIERLKD